MKRLFVIFIVLLLFTNTIYADSGVKVSMDDITFHMLTGYSDQSDKVKVSRFYNLENYPTFCIEPEVTYLPNKYHYKKYTYDDENIYKIVKAYSLLDPEYNNDNLYIAAQIMIWKYVSGNDYTFEGNDYATYQTQINSFIENDYHLETDVLSSIDINSNNPNFIKIKGNYLDYDIDDENIEVISKDENELVIKLLNNIKEISVKLKRKNNLSKQYLYSSVANDSSDGSQDLYSFEDIFYNNDLILNLKIENEVYDLHISKKDSFNNNIKDTKFTLYQLDDDGSNNLYFLKINNEINLVKNILNIDDDSNYNIKLSERYSRYLNNNVIKTDELGFFEFEIYNNDSLVLTNKVYVCNNIDEAFKTIKVNSYKDLYTTNDDINTFKNVESKNNYYLCESEPAKGFEFNNNPCKLIDSNTYNGETLEFNNIERHYSFKLLKNNRNDILLNGALFKISYYEDDELKSKLVSTGDLLIENKDNYKYIVYSLNNNTKIEEINSDLFKINNAEQGRYFYYLTNENNINESLLTNYVDVINGGFILDGLPYSSKVIIEEIMAPNGYMITEPIYELYPNIKYSEITFSNYRVNEFEILPKKRKRKEVKTCIDE